MKRIVVPVLIAGAIAAGFYAGRISSACAGKEGDGPKASAESAWDAAKLAKAERRIAELERRLAAARKRQRPDADSSDTANRVQPADDKTVVVGGTNVDIIAELKKNLSDEEFDQATNAMSRIKAKMAEKAQDRMAFLKSIDTSAFSGFVRLSTSTTPFATTALPYFCRRCAARRLAQSARSLSTPRM